jgi:hypothetical protein
MKNPKHEFIEFLLNTARCKLDKDALLKTTEILQERLLDFGSHTPDNLACAQDIELRTRITDLGPPESQSVAIKNSPYSIADILHSAEGCPTPKQVEEYCPDLTQEQWDNALRFTTLVLLSLQWDSNDSKES